MQRRQFTAVALLPGWAGAGDAWALTESDAAAGIRDALRRAAGSAVASLGRNDGFLGNAAARLGLAQAQPRKVQEHVTDKALDGVFLLLAQAERELRADPLAAGSALLKRVFGR